MGFSLRIRGNKALVCGERDKPPKYGLAFVSHHYVLGRRCDEVPNSRGV